MKKHFVIWGRLTLLTLAMLACGMPSLALVEPSPTPRPTRTARPTFTPTPTETLAPTVTPTRTPTAVPPTATATNTPLPTDTPPPTAPPPPPTSTPRPRPTNTPAPPPPPPPPTQSPYEFTGSLGSLEQSYSCKITNAFIAIRVIDRNGKPLKGYVPHVGQDGSWSKWAFPSTDSLKDADKAYAYNADFGVSFGVKYYISLFREEVEPFNINLALSGPKEVEIYFPPKDDDECETTGRTKGIRVAPVIFTYNR